MFCAVAVAVLVAVVVGLSALDRVTAEFDCLSRRYKMINFNAAAAARDLSHRN